MDFERIRRAGNRESNAVYAWSLHRSGYRSSECSISVRSAASSGFDPNPLIEIGLPALARGREQ
ncbi:MAG TPA: hypothetical protein VJ914_28715 [Pseudonocardiaceae bacterium]|nr:hypothetical protein [Pseudonocardiaceae bacterium]